MTNRTECVDFVAYREARRPHGITEVQEIPAGEECPVREWEVAGVGCWQCDGELQSVRWNVALDPLTGSVLTHLVCGADEHEHEMIPAPEETEAERLMREGVVHYLAMVFGVPFRARAPLTNAMSVLLLLLSLVA